MLSTMDIKNRVKEALLTSIDEEVIKGQASSLKF
jgi:hypothetical protein